MDVMINGTRFVAERLPTSRKQKFHKLIKTARKKNMGTLEETAKAIGTTKSHIWTLEQGNTMPKLPILQRILRHYGLQFDEIADE